MTTGCYCVDMPDAVRYTHDPVKALRRGAVQWKGKLLLPPRWTVEVDDPGSPYKLTLSIEVVDRQPVLESVQITCRELSDPVTPRKIRERPLARYLHGAVHTAALVATPAPDGSSVSYEPAFGPGDELHPLLDTSRRQQARITPEFLAEVAAVYNNTVTHKRQAVMNDPRWEPVAPQTASRWIKEARDAGLIPKRGTR
jgi:hypothetical protein